MPIKKAHYENFARDEGHDARIKSWLSARPDEGHAYNTIGKALSLDWHVVLHALQAMVLNDPDVIEYWPLSRTPGAKITAKERATRLFRIAPDRKTIDAHPWRTEEVVVAAITEFLADGPKSKRVIYRAMRDRFVHLDERIVDRCMAAMPLDRMGNSKSSTRYVLIDGIGGDSEGASEA